MSIRQIPIWAVASTVASGDSADDYQLVYHGDLPHTTNLCGA